MYRDLKAKVKTIKSDFDYDILFNNFYQAIFNYDKRLFRPDILDNILHTTGISAIIKTDTSDFTPVFCCLVGGDRYADGLFKDAVCYDMRAFEYRFSDWRNNPEISVVFNTPSITADDWIYKNIMMLTDIDTSIINNIIFSRYHKIPVVHDKKEKTQIDTALSDIEKGKSTTVYTEFNIKDIAEGKSAIETMDLTDVTKSQYIQYLIHAYDAIFSRTCMLMGLDVPDNGKQAQITTDELNRHEDISLIMPSLWYTARKTALDKLGLKIEYSSIMQSRFRKAETETKTEEKGETENENANETDDDVLQQTT